MSTVLAQLANIGGAGVQPLPSPPLWEYLLLESPLAFFVALIVVEVLVCFESARRRSLRLQVVGTLAVFAVAMILLVVSRSIETEREKLQARTRELIDAAATVDIATLDPLLSESVGINLLAGMSIPAGKQGLLRAVREYLGERYPLAEHSIGRVQASVDGVNVARTQVRVWVKPKERTLYDFATGGWYRLDWRRDPVADQPGQFGPWRVSSISMLQLDGIGQQN